jgi:hypothetical protein
VAVVWLIGATVASVVSRSGNVVPIRGTSFWQVHLIPLGVTLAAGMLAVAVWLITTRAVGEADRFGRWWTRHLAWIPLLCMGMAHVQNELWWSGSYALSLEDYRIERVLGWMIFLISWPWLVAFPLLFFTYLRAIGRRLMSRQLMEHSVIVGVGLSASAVFASGTILLGEHAESIGLPTTWTSRSDVFLMLMVLSVTAATLFALWTCFLVLRFAICFSVESRAMRQLLREADRGGSA